MEVVCGIKDLTKRRYAIGSGPEMAGNSQLDGGKLEMNAIRLTDAPWYGEGGGWEIERGKLSYDGNGGKF